MQAPGQVQRGSGEGSEGSEGSRAGLGGRSGREVWEALVQSQLRFNRVPERKLMGSSAQNSSGVH